MQGAIRIIRVGWREYGPQVALVRQKVFALEMRFSPEQDQDGRDPQSTHVLALSPDGEAIGTGRLDPGGRIGRIAVLMPWRQLGVGSALLDELITIAREQGQHHISLAAPITAQGFYENHAFEPDGNVYMSAGIPYRNMQLSLLTYQKSAPAF